MPASSPPETAATLTALMRDFDRDDASRRRIGELLVAGPEAFCDAAAEVLKTPGDSRAFHHVIAMLASSGLLLPVLCHPGLNRERALAVARIAQRADPQVETAIARRLADSVSSGVPGVPCKEAGRLLEVLAEISDGSRIMVSLLRLLRHPNPHLRSKVVKMIGRGTHNAKWLRSRLAEPDARVRANAVESLWGADTSEAHDLLRSCVHDSDNRVAGNALVALYRIGDCGSIPGFFRMATHVLPRARATAAWAMGETGDPRFLCTLAHLLRDEHHPVRARALAGLGRIKAVLAKARQTNPWRVAGMVQDNPQHNLRRLQLAISTGDGGAYPVALGTGFLVTEDGQPVIAYRAAVRPCPEIMSVSFVFPRSGASSTEPWVRGALSCRPWKRTSDLWSLQPYVPPQDSAEPEHAGRSAADPPRLTAGLEGVEGAFQQVPNHTQCAGFWHAVQQAFMSECAGSGGKRHAIVFSPYEILLPPPEDLTPFVAAGTQIQVLSTVPNPVLEDFCCRVRGIFERVESLDEVAGLIRSFYLNLPTRYEIAYTPVSPACRTVKVHIRTAAGWGEAAFPVTGGPVNRWLVAEPA